MRADAAEGAQQVDARLAYFAWIWRTIVGERSNFISESGLVKCG